jgi:uncharacterized protein YjgD (DUF1641 family)
MKGSTFPIAIIKEHFMDTLSSPGVLEHLTVEDFRRLEAKLDRIEAMLVTPHELMGQVPHLTATVTNMADELVERLAARHVDVDARAHQVLDLMERLTHPSILTSAEHFVRRPENVAQLLGALEQAPGTLAMIVNIADDVVAHLQREGVDLEEELKRVAVSMKVLVEFLQSEEFVALMDSGVFAPDTIKTITKMAQALQFTHKEDSVEVGVFEALRRTRDPSIRHALDFGLRFARRFGVLLAKPARALTSQ